MPQNIFQRIDNWARDELNLYKLRSRAFRNALSRKISGASAIGSHAHGLFLFHETNAEVEQHFDRLARETEGLITWHKLYNPGNWASPQTDLDYRHAALSMPWRFDQMARHGGIVPGGFADLAIIPVVLATKAPFVWIVEYDVDYAGDWGDFFRQFSANYADLLTTSLASRRQNPGWSQWRNVRTPTHIHRSKNLRSFNPLMRLSRRFASAYVETLRDKKWRGHYEFTLPTVAAINGFIVEDIGGKGRLCPIGRKGKNYASTPTSATLEPGTFVWRPAKLGYFSTRPELFSNSNFLYHPCKSGIPAYDWDNGVERMRQGCMEIAPRRIVVAMATYNGARHLKAQLASLAKQTRLPDELVIGDDCSTDGTVAILKEFASDAPFPVTIVERTKQLGYAQNFTDVATRSTWDMLLFCDQDDIWKSEKIELLANAAEAVPALAFSHDLSVFYTTRKNAGNPLPSYFEHLRKIGLDENLCGKGCALAVRSGFIETWGWAPEDSGISHDAWITLLTTAMGQRALIDAPLVRHRIHGKNTSGWIVGEDEAKRRTKTALDDPFASMLDFYVVDSNTKWIDPLRSALETTGMQVDPVRAKRALQALRAIE